jgi:N-acetylneuraminic acid mutarotase
MPRSRAFLTIALAGLLLESCGQATSTSWASAQPLAATPSPVGESAVPSAAPVTPTPTGAVAPSMVAAAWRDAGQLQHGRNAANVVAVRGGRVLVVGSDYETSWLGACGAATEGSDAVEIGDPVKAAWKETTSLRTPREAPAVVGLRDGRALVTGGERGENDGNVSYSSTYVFDPAGESWTRSGLMNAARSNPSAVLLQDGRVLVAGGRYIDGRHDPRLLDDSELWDPTTGTWSRTGRLAHVQIGASAVVLEDGRVLLVGGVASRESHRFEQASAEIYDPMSGRWTSAGSLATSRSGFALVALADGGALVAGGFGGGGTTNPLNRLATAERFDPTMGQWARVDDLPIAVAGASAIRLTDDRILLAGGSAREAALIDVNAGTYASGFTADAFLFDPATGAWGATTPMPHPRAGASIVGLSDGSAVLVGGSSSEGNPIDTPSCPVPDPQVLRYVPGH